jgi:hypothetical protein
LLAGDYILHFARRFNHRLDLVSQITDQQQ